MAVARMLFQPRQRVSAGARLLLAGAHMVGRGHMANAGARAYVGVWGQSSQPGSSEESPRWGF